MYSFICTFITLQVIISLVIPPAGIWSGWPCFFVSLALIGGVTAIIGELVTILGCLLIAEDDVTGIKFTLFLCQPIKF